MIFTIPLEIYRTRVHVIYDEPDCKAEKYYNRFGGDFSDGLVMKEHVEARCICDESGTVFVRFRSNPPNSTIAHEFLHAVFFILGDRGLSLDSSSEEAYTYLLGHLIDKFHTKTAVKAK